MPLMPVPGDLAGLFGCSSSHFEERSPDNSRKNLKPLWHGGVPNPSTVLDPSPAAQNGNLKLTVPYYTTLGPGARPKGGAPEPRIAGALEGLGGPPIHLWKARGRTRSCWQSCQHTTSLPVPQSGFKFCPRLCHIILASLPLSRYNGNGPPLLLTARKWHDRARCHIL